MGQRGPAPKPNELKLLEGNRGNRPLNLNETFRPQVGLPDAPRWLSKEGRKAFKRLSAELLQYNLLSRVDADAFAMLCQTVGRIEQLERSLAARVEQLLAEGKDAVEAYQAKTPNGMAIQSVPYQILSKEQDKLRALIAEFGLSPAQRARVTTAIRTQIPLFDVNAGAGTGGEGGQAPPPTEPRGFSSFT